MKLTDKIKLVRPLAIFDIESTGTSPRTDRIIELAIVRVEPDGTQAVKTWLVDPTIPIPHETTQIHGIYDIDVIGKPTFSEIVDEVDSFIAGCDLGGYNVIHFDIPILEEEFNRCGRNLDVDSRHIVDAQKIFHKKEPRDLSAAVRFFCGHDHEGAHGAEADALATLDVLVGQCERYGDIPDSVEKIELEFNNIDPTKVDRSGRFKWENGEVVVNFGKKKGEKLRDLAQHDKNFLKWMVNGDFPIDTRNIAANAMKGEFPSPPAKGGE